MKKTNENRNIIYLHFILVIILKFFSFKEQLYLSIINKIFVHDKSKMSEKREKTLAFFYQKSKMSEKIFENLAFYICTFSRDYWEVFSFKEELY